MCGIVGILSLSGAPALPETLRAMAASIAHRGPDGEGFFTEGPVGLGHRRLSIIDLESGSQPMHSASGEAVLVFNGEIYNFPELRDELLAKGYPFRTRSDTEVILALYETQGEAGLRRLSGMFAFALWDRRRRRLVLARDRAGMKPLYYARVAGHLVFASELKAIRVAFPELDRLEPGAVNFYFSRQYVGGAATMFEGIRKVRPASWLIVDGEGRMEETIYWRLDPSLRSKVDLAEAERHTDELLRDAVRSHLIADVPVGLFLSGGLDSGCLLSYAAEAAGRRLQTFSVGFGEDSELSETHFARRIAEAYGTEHHEIHVTEAEMLGCLPHVIRGLDQPLADYAILPTYAMSRFAAESVKVVLSGEGADEVFGGYKRYHAYALRDRLPFRRWLGQAPPGPSVFPETQRRRLLHPDRFIELHKLPQETQLRAAQADFAQAGHLNAMLYADQGNWLVDDLLMKVDNMGMLASIEARIPYLDPPLVEYVATLDGRLKVTLRQRKRLLRALAAKRLPPEILRRPKHGFTPPVADWLRGPLRPAFREAVLGTQANAEWLDLRFVERLFSEHLRGRDHRLRLWSILVFCLWRAELRGGSAGWSHFFATQTDRKPGV